VCVQHRPNHTQTEPASPHHPDQPVQPDHTARPGHYLTPNPHPSRVSHVRTVELPPISPNRATAASRSKSLVLPIRVTTVMIHRRAAFVTISPPSRSTRHGPRLCLRERCQRRSSFSPPDRRRWSSFSSTSRCPDATPSRSRPRLIGESLPICVEDPSHPR
jgi:hypothetical protein